MIRKFTLLLIPIFLTSLMMNAQKKIVHGKIVAFKNIPVQKAEVRVQKSKIKVFSDSLGYFSVLCELKDKISIKVAGFKTERIKVENFTDSLFIKMEFNGSEKDLDMVSSNGHITKENLIYATDYLDTEIFDDMGYTTVLEMISGKFPGVSIVENEIRIRGIRSLTGKNAALIVIDGNITDMSTLKGLHASDVKSIKVLKGAQAAIYGSRGANGAVLLTTTGSRARK